MSALEHLLIHYTAVFTLVLARVGGLIATAPLLSNASFPAQVQGLLAVTLALLITPLQIATASATPDNLIEFAHTLVLETLVGVLLGVGVTILISGVQLAGQTVSQLSGVSMADVISPGFDESVSAYTQLMYMVTLSVFVAIGGHRLMIDALLSTFEWAPPGKIQLGDDFFHAVTTLSAQSFELGLHRRAAADRDVPGDPRAGADQPHVTADQHHCRRLQHQRDPARRRAVHHDGLDRVDVPRTNARVAHRNGNFSAFNGRVSCQWSVVSC